MAVLIGGPSNRTVESTANASAKGPHPLVNASQLGAMSPTANGCSAAAAARRWGATPVATGTTAWCEPEGLPGAERQVEFIGAPGVGKSAICRATLPRLAKLGVYRSAEQGRYMALKVSLGGAGVARRTACMAAARLPRLGSLLAQRLARGLSQETFRQSLRAQGAFLECCIEMAVSGFGDEFVRFVRLQNMFDDLLDLHLWGRLPQGVHVLQEDALVQKGWACARGQRERFFTLVPKPRAAILVTAPPEVVFERLCARRRRQIDAHVGLGDEELRAHAEESVAAFALGAEILRGHGVGVLEVDGREPVPDAAAKAAAFLSSQTAH